MERYISNNNVNVSKADLFQAFAIFGVVLRIMTREFAKVIETMKNIDFLQIQKNKALRRIS